MAESLTTTTISVPDVCCAAEETSVRNAFRGVEGIEELQFDLTNRTIRVKHSNDTPVLLETLTRAGFPGRVTSHRTDAHSGVPAFRRVTTLLSLFFLAGGLASSLATTDTVLPDIFYFASMILGGWEIALRCFRALRAVRLDVNVLMTAAAAGALLLGEYAEAAAVLSLYSLSLLLEAISIDRTRRAIGDLLALAPGTANVRTDEGEQKVPIDLVRPGDVIVIRPGERVPLDGRVLHGETSVDEAQLTGEPLPVFKREGSEVFAGSLNGRGALEVSVTAGSDGTLLHTIGEMVVAAQRKKSTVQSLLERFAAWYVPSVFAAAILAAVIPPLLFGQDWGEWFYRSLTLLVVSCPCAMLLSTPMAVVSAISGAARHGALIRSGDVLERLSFIRAVAIDKTGTVTRGFHEVTEVRPLDGMDEKTILRISSLLESRSEHPLATAILRHARRHDVSAPGSVSAFEVLPGRGVRGTIDGSAYIIGNHALIEEAGVCSPEVEREIQLLEADGQTVLILSDATRPIGLIATKDTPRSEAGTAIRAIEGITGHPVTVLTGDNRSAGEALGRDLNISSVRSGLLPAEKSREIERIRAEHGPVAMVGDGINDAPALAQADVGIAMGAAGSDTAIEAADVVLLSSSFSSVPALLRLGKATRRTIQFNIFLSLLAKGVFLVLGVFGFSSLWLAILADDGVTLLVLLNSLRLLSFGRFAEPAS